MKQKLVFRSILLLAVNFIISSTYSQTTFPVNGIAEPSDKTYAFTNATIVKEANTTLTNATLIISNKKIIAVGTSVVIPKDAVTVDCKGKYIYPSFIDIYSDYGIASVVKPAVAFNYNAPAQFTSSVKGAYGWNQAIRPEINASEIFNVDDAKAMPFREAGFGTAALIKVAVHHNLFPEVSTPLPCHSFP